MIRERVMISSRCRAWQILRRRIMKIYECFSFMSSRSLHCSRCIWIDRYKSWTISMLWISFIFSSRKTSNFEILRSAWFFLYDVNKWFLIWQKMINHWLNFSTFRFDENKSNLNSIFDVASNSKFVIIRIRTRVQLTHIFHFRTKYILQLRCHYSSFRQSFSWIFNTAHWSFETCMFILFVCQRTFKFYELLKSLDSYAQAHKSFWSLARN